MKRTVAAARRALDEDVIPGLSDYWANKFRALMAEEEARARAIAAEHVAQQSAEVLKARKRAMEELTRIRDASEDLNSAVKVGRIDARDAARQLSDIRARQKLAETALATAEEKVAGIEKVEADPIAYTDDLMQRTPL